MAELGGRRRGEEAAGGEGEQNYQFYKEYCRLYYANIILTNRLQQLLNEKKDLQGKLNRLEVSRNFRRHLPRLLIAGARRSAGQVSNRCSLVDE